MFCTKCGAEINEGSAFCAQCGAPVSQQNNSNTEQPGNSIITKTPYNTMSIIGFVISCISLLINFWGLVGMAGLIVSLVGLLQLNKNNENGKFLAIAGIVVGTFSVFYGFFQLLSLY